MLMWNVSYVDVYGIRATFRTRARCQSEAESNFEFEVQPGFKYRILCTYIN